MRRVAAGEPYVIRQQIPAEGITTFHDAVYRRRDRGQQPTLDDQVLIKSGRTAHL